MGNNPKLRAIMVQHPGYTYGISLYNPNNPLGLFGCMKTGTTS